MKMNRKSRYSKIVKRVSSARCQNCGHVYRWDKGALRNFPCPKCGGEGEPYKSTIYASCRVCGEEIPWSLDFTSPACLG